MAKRNDGTITMNDLHGEHKVLLAGVARRGKCVQLWSVLVIKDEAYSQRFCVRDSSTTKVYTDLSPAIRQFNHLVTGEGWQ